MQILGGFKKKLASWSFYLDLLGKFKFQHLKSLAFVIKEFAAS